MSTKKHENTYQFFTFAIRPAGGLSNSQYDALVDYMCYLKSLPNVMFWSIGLETCCNTAGYCNASSRHCHVTIILKEPKRTRYIKIPSLDPDYNRIVLGAKHKVNFVPSRDYATIGYSIKGFNYIIHDTYVCNGFVQTCHDAWNAKDRSLTQQIEKRIVVSRNNLTQIVCTHKYRITTEEKTPNLYEVLVDMVRSKEYTFTMIHYQARLPLEVHSDILSEDAILEVFTNKLRGEEFRSLNKSLYQNGIDITGEDIPMQPQPYTGNSSIFHPNVIGGTFNLGSTTELPPGILPKPKPKAKTIETDEDDYLFSDPEDVQNNLDFCEM